MADTALKNPNKAQYESSVGGMETTIRNTNEANKAIVNSAAGTETSIVNQRDAQKYKRLSDQEARLNNIESTFDQQVGDRRGDLDTIRKRQEAVAARNANMAVAQAGQGGLQLSEGEKQSINDDTLAKYGENIITADQARYQGNASLDQAQKGAKLEVYAKRSDINGLLASLDDAGKAALIDAARKARDGDIEAEKQVANSILEYQKKITDERYNRYAQVEKFNENENTFRTGTIEQKVALATAQLGDTPGADLVAKRIRDNINAYPDMDLTSFVNLMKQEASNTSAAVANAIALIQSGQATIKDFPELKEYLSGILKYQQGSNERAQTPISKESTAGNQYDSKTFQSTNTQTTGLKYPTTQEISQVKQVLDRGLAAKTLTQKEYDRYQFGLNKIQKSGMDAQAYANTYGNPAWLARLGKAK